MNPYLRAHAWRLLTFLKTALLKLVTFFGNLLFSKSAPLDLKNIERILIMHGEHSSIGDAVLFSAIFHPLRKRFPKARIEVLIRHPAEEVIKYNGNVDEIIPYMAENGTNLITQEFAPYSILKSLKARNYDLVITSEHALRFILLSYLTGARNRVGFDLEGRGFLLTRKVPYPKYENRNKLELQYYLDLVRALGMEISPEREWMKINYRRGEKEFAERFLHENGISKNDFIVGIHAGGGIWKKRWPLFKFAKLADKLEEKYGAKIIALGGKEDVILANQIQKMMKTPLAIAAGKAGILQTAALVEKCNLVIANDSAISHISAAAGVKTIALFGVDSPVRWGPFQNVSIMKHRRLPACNLLCNYNYMYAVDACFQPDKPFCMDLITVEDVISEFKRLQT